MVNLHLIYPHFIALLKHRAWADTRKTFLSPEQSTCQLTIDFLIESLTDGIDYLNGRLKLHMSALSKEGCIKWENITVKTTTSHPDSCPFQTETEHYYCSFYIITTFLKPWVFSLSVWLSSWHCNRICW